MAKDLTGYQHLMMLSSLHQRLTGDQTLTLADIKPYMTHLMVVTTNGETAYWLNQGNQQAVSDYLTTLKSATDDNSVLLGVSAQQSATYRQLLSKTAADLRTPQVALPTVQYLNADDRFVVSVLEAIKDGTTISNLAEAQQKTGQYWLKPAATFDQEYQEVGLQSAAEMTAQVAAACQVQLKFQHPQLPQFKTPDQTPSKTYLRTQCETGLKQRLATNQITDADPYWDRLNHELDVIDRMGFDDYFLIVWDVMQFTKKAGITTGPGRGLLRALWCV